MYNDKIVRCIFNIAYQPMQFYKKKKKRQIKTWQNAQNINYKWKEIPFLRSKE